MGFVGAVKDWLNVADEDDMYEDEMFEQEEIEEEPAPRSYFSSHKTSRIVPLSSGDSQTNIMVLKPKCFNNCKAVADELKNRRPVVIDVGALDVDEARRVIDFISGTVYGINGKMEKITSGIFVATPHSLGIMGDVAKTDEFII